MLQTFYMLLQASRLTLKSIISLIFLITVYNQVSHAQTLQNGPKWNLVQKTFSNAIAHQTKQEPYSPIISNSQPMRGFSIGPTKQKGIKRFTRSQKPVLFPRQRKKVKLGSGEQKPLTTFRKTHSGITEKLKDEKKGIWRFEIGNEDRGIFVDLWEPIFDPIFGGSPTDGGMSWGFHLSYTPHKGNPGWAQRVRKYMPWINSTAKSRVSYSLEQSANMHSSLTRKTRNLSEHLWTVDQRPDVGYIAGNARIGLQDELNRKWRRVDMVDLTTGIIGPYSGAQAFHQTIHDLTGGSTDKWHQVNSEPFINLDYQYGHRFFLWDPKGRETIEIHPTAGFALGSVFTNVKTGLNIRFGRLLENDMGAPRLANMLTGTNFPLMPDRVFSWNAFAGIEGRAHIYNAFLDENLISGGGQNVDTHPFTYDVQAGMEFGYSNYRLTFMNVYRSREFKGQMYTTEFIRVSLAAEF